ncbi:ABC transporter permease [Tsukamurella sp. 8F]|uniref:ABC transporter permease n=1 Tax=unclassified Tsukamurella TaxID=2633480 RepID=UPI0023B93FFD|nr:MULTISPECIES: ABC transporter permease [unclassified Tsukamurella]MDF0529593.1 ABC transporter permease [Tsukamurella sp. 8J]MDF0585719.1 ABC transporter permease [Tsukamurella sp. 8F]
MPDNIKPGQERFVAPPDEVKVDAIDAVDADAQPAGFWRSAWRELRTKPAFIVSAVLIVLILVVVLFPGLFAHQDPHYADLARSMDPPSSHHLFGTDKQGYDIYSRTIYGARASVLVGVLTTIVVVVLGGLVGTVAGFFGGWIDSVLSRLSDIFFGIPLILAAVVTLQAFPTRNVMTVVIVLAIFSWPQIARIARSASIAIRGDEFITAAKSLGASRFRTLFTHVVPNVLGPVIVIATISLGIFIVTEATLSYLGIGLPSTAVSWGIDISAAQTELRSGSPILFYPATALAITVLAFMMLGDALRDALDPKARTR